MEWAYRVLARLEYRTCSIEIPARHGKSHISQPQQQQDTRQRNQMAHLVQTAVNTTHKVE